MKRKITKRAKQMTAAVLAGSILFSQSSVYAASQDIEFSDKLATITVDQDTKIYTEPSAESKGVAYLMEGDSAQQIAEADGWAKIIYEDQICFIQLETEEEETEVRETELNETELFEEETNDAESPETESVDSEPETEAEGQVLTPSDVEWFKNIEICGAPMVLPATVETLEDAGWTPTEYFEEEYENELEVNHSCSAPFFEKDGMTLQVEFLNETEQTMLMRESLISGISVWSVIWSSFSSGNLVSMSLDESTIPEICLPEGIQNRSLKDDIIQAYGEPIYTEDDEEGCIELVYEAYDSETSLYYYAIFGTYIETDELVGIAFRISPYSYF